jgi:hypothetical protein
MGVWEYGSVGVWECGSVGVWECGSVGEVRLPGAQLVDGFHERDDVLDRSLRQDPMT